MPFTVLLVGVAHPSPAKAAQFRSVDLEARKAAIESARGAGVNHFIYLSVARPAPVMKACIQARAECERALIAREMNARGMGWGRDTVGLICYDRYTR
ncbi:MAG TPA: hypothetical protein VJQ82_22830 [Terriglobales bacterium]|nr:hypothetical protein [Terriglobales bacterium]